MFGAAILLIAVQFASVAAEAHFGHSHGLDRHGFQGHGLQGHFFQGHGAGAGATRSISFDETAAANQAVRAQSAARAGIAVESEPGTATSSGTGVNGCCGTGAGCCGAALAAVPPSLPPNACSLRIGFARLGSVGGVDPQGLCKPPRSLA
jgi:hypothetical protein